MMLQEEYSESEIQPELFMNFRFEGKTNFHTQRANLTEYCDWQELTHIYICFLELFWAQCYVKLCGVCCCCCCSGRKQWRCLILEAGWPGSVFWAVCGSGTGLRRDVGETQLTKLFSLRILFLFFYTLGRNARLGMWLPLTEPPLCLQRRFALFLRWGKFLTHTHTGKRPVTDTLTCCLSQPPLLWLEAVWSSSQHSSLAL